LTLCQEKTQLYQPLSSSASCAKELFKPSKDLASLRISNEKKMFGFGLRFVVSDVVSKVDFWPFCLLVPDWVQPLDRSISLKFH